MKKITFVCFNADHPRTGYAVRVMENVKELISKGYDVSVLRLVPAFHSSKSWRQMLSSLGVKSIHELPVLPISKYSLLRLLSPYLAFVWFYMHQIRFKSSIVIAEGHEAAGVCLLYKICPTIVDVHGAVIEEVIFSRKQAGRPFKHIVYWLDRFEGWIVDKADGILVVSENMSEYLAKKWPKLDKSKLAFLPVVFSGSNQSINSRRVVSKSYRFVYSGGVQAYQCLDETISVFAQIKEVKQDAELHILTPDVDLAKDKVISQYKYLPEFIRIKSVPQSEVGNHLRLADFGFVLRSDDLLNKVSCPTKINEYLAAGLIIICSPFSGHGPSAVSQTGAGVVISVDDLMNSSKKIISILDDVRDKYSFLAVQKYLEKYQPNAAFTALHKMMNEILK